MGEGLPTSLRQPGTGTPAFPATAHNTAPSTNTPNTTGTVPTLFSSFARLLFLMFSFPILLIIEVLFFQVAFTAWERLPENERSGFLRSQCVAQR